MTEHLRTDEILDARSLSLSFNKEVEEERCENDL